MKILVNLPDYKHIHGGVTNHFVGLRPHWTEEVEYNRIGKRREGCSGLWWLPYDYAKFALKCVFRRPDIVLVNPSFNRKAYPRDMMFMKIARMLKVPVAVMFHGWTDSYVKSLNQKKMAETLDRSCGIFLLASDFADQLKRAGVSASITLTTTKVADSLVDGIELPETGAPKQIRNILFLARVVKEKGIFTTLDTFKLLKNKHPELTLTVAGDGEALEEAMRYADEKGMRDVTFTGHIEGTKIKTAFMEADLYLLPTTHPEGMPTSVLEAMAVGLPVITRPMGGVKDFFEDGKMGFLTESVSAKEYASLIEKLIEHPRIAGEMSAYNARYARLHFLASKVAVKMEAALKDCLRRSTP